MKVQPKITKTVAAPPPGPEIIPLDQKQDAARTRPARPSLVKGLAKREPHLCEACRLAQQIHTRIVTHINHASDVIRFLKQALLHRHENPDTVSEWEHEGVDAGLVTAFTLDLEEMLKRYTTPPSDNVKPET